MSTELRVGSLFSGYGGLDRAVEQVFGARTVWHSQYEPPTKQNPKPSQAPSKLLAYRTGLPNHGDITTIDWATVEPVEIVCAGWPCQPFSLAGQRLGALDDRALWPHVARAIRLLRPRIVVLENVSAVLTAGEFDRVAADLAEFGYQFGWLCLRASDVGATHRRNRLFIVARDTTDERRHPGAAPEWSDGHSSARGSDRLVVEDANVAARGERWEPAPGQAESRWPRTDLGRRDRTSTADAGRDAWAEDDTDLAAAARGSRASADATGDGRHEGWPEPAWQLGGHDAPECGPVSRADIFAGRWCACEPATDSDNGSDDRQWARPESDYGSPAVADADGTALWLQSITESGRGGQAFTGWGGAAPAYTDSDGLALIRREQAERRDIDGRGGSDTAWGPYEPAIRRWERVTGRVAPAPTEANSKGGQRLSPAFVEWMMGLPAGWVTAVPGISRNDQLKMLGNGVVPQQAIEALRRLGASA